MDQNENSKPEERIRSQEREIGRLHFHIGLLCGHLGDTARALEGVAVELDGDRRQLVQALARLIAAKVEDADVRARAWRRS